MPIGLSPPCVLPLPPWPILPSPLTGWGILRMLRNARSCPPITVNQPPNAISYHSTVRLPKSGLEGWPWLERQPPPPPPGSWSATCVTATHGHVRCRCPDSPIHLCLTAPSGGHRPPDGQHLYGSSCEAHPLLSGCGSTPQHRSHGHRVNRLFRGPAARQDLWRVWPTGRPQPPYCGCP